MSTRIYVFLDTDKKIEDLAKKLKISKSQAVEIAINDHHRRHFKERK